MACFLVPATEAIVTTIATGIIEKKETQQTAHQAKTLHTEMEEKTEYTVAESKYSDQQRMMTEDDGKADLMVETARMGSEAEKITKCSGLQGRTLSGKLKWLNTMLWGGSALLAFEHLWHGEIVPWYPFLTAAGNPDATAQMFHEMSTVGVAMAGVVTLGWAAMVAFSGRMEKRSEMENGFQEEL